jgi:hypothetical protein
LSAVTATPALATPTPPFTQCPPVSNDTSCGTLIVVNANSSMTAYNDAAQGPYDGGDDTMIGVQNESSAPISSIALSGAPTNTPIFGLEGDGICAPGNFPAPPACPYGTTGYEGPGTSFTSSDDFHGVVHFAGSGLAPGASTYFSLEDPIKLACNSTGCETVPPAISLTPHEAMNDVGTTHTVTATVVANGSPQSGKTVNFGVEVGPNMGKMGSGVTDINGQATFTYHDDGGPGTDIIAAAFTSDTGGLEEATASKTWSKITANNEGTCDPKEPEPRCPGINTTEGVHISATVATFHDPDPTEAASGYEATIDWGDGTSAGTITGGGGNFAVSGSHTYAEEGAYAVSVKITDIDAPSDRATAHAAANVVDAALSASGVTATGPASFSGTVANFTDVNAGAPTGDFTAMIEWGDGATSSGTVSGGGGSYSVGGTHTYGSVGTFTVKVHIVDDGGSTADATSKVIVEGTRWYSNGELIEEGKRETDATSGQLTINLKSAVTCTITDTEEVENGINGGTGSLTAITFSGCTRQVNLPCPGTEVHALPASLPWPVHLLFGSHVAIEHIEIEVTCTTNNSIHEKLVGTLTPTLGSSVYLFGSAFGSGSLTKPGSTHGWLVTGFDNIIGPPGDETVTMTDEGTPTAVTEPATGVTQAVATLNGTVNPNGRAVTACLFEYGLTAPSYEGSVPCQALPGSGTAPVAVAAAVGSLKANTTYHFRVVATNSAGTHVGVDRTFKTAEPAVGPRFFSKAAIGGVAPRVPFTGTIGATSLETTGKAKLTCSGGSTTGEVSGPVTATGMLVRLTGCETSGLKCQSSGQPEGTVQTFELAGVLGELTATTPGLQLMSESEGRGGKVAEFECGGGLAKGAITGSVIGSLSGASGKTVAEGKLATSAKLTFVQTGGKQRYERFSGELQEEQLTATLNGTPEEAGQAAVATIKSMPAGNFGFTK